MKLWNAWFYALNPKQAGATIHIQEHGSRLAAESAGSIEKVREDKTTFSDEWRRTSGDFGFTIDPKALSAGILRVGYAVNDFVVEQIKKAHK